MTPWRVGAIRYVGFKSVDVWQCIGEDEMVLQSSVDDSNAGVE